MSEILNEPFSIVCFKQLIAGLVAHEFYDEAKQISYKSDVIDSVENIGTFQESRFHNILVIKHKLGIAARVKLATETFKLMASNNVDAALIAYYSEENGLWRVSLVTLTFEEAKSGRITKTISNPRRFSYILGPSAKIATARKFLSSRGRTTDFEDLISRFSVEVVNNEFYREIAKLYDELVGTDAIPAAMKYPNAGEANHQFAVRLIGRIVFCWFLREKHSANGVALISKGILSSESAKQNDYYNSVLAPLFFEVLNRPIAKRVERLQKGDFGKVPYLNGGLFAHQPDDHYGGYDSTAGRSVSESITIPDVWLRKLFDLLELYHFTVDENTSIDIDLSIDPEMLGRIFENLLARINPETGESVRKSTGSFYTPREIVEYMVDESLLQYLKSKIDIPQQSLRALISYSLSDDQDLVLQDAHRIQIVKAISELKVLDPACGSGAFPIGMLQKIVFILQRVDADARLWLDEQTRGIPELRRQLQTQSLDYIRKLYIIRKSIFGVDIQPIATEIARLRCFLTLIVDEDIDDLSDNRGVKVLPNLDFKFVTANSLKKAPGAPTDAPTLFNSFEQELVLIVNDYFTAEGAEKAELSHRLRDTIDKKIDENISFVLNNSGVIKDERFEDAFNAKNRKVNSALLEEAAAWRSYRNIFNHQLIDFFETRYIFPSVTDGFDIVIANPPYGAKISAKDRKRINAAISVPEKRLNPNSAGLFIDVALERFLSKDGCLTYIVPKSLLYSEKWQLNVERIIDNTITIVDVEKAFEDVLLEQVVFVYSQTERPEYYYAQKFLNEKVIRSIKIEKKIAKQLRAWICDVSEEELRIAKTINTTQFVADVTTTKRGVGIQKYLSKSGQIPVIGGKNISRFSVLGEKGYVDKSYLAMHKNKLDFMAKPKIVSQDLVAHIQNPVPHIKITSAIDTEGKLLGLDTVQNTVVTDDRYSLELLCALLNSKLVNWYVYKFIYCSAIRTMHLDNYYLGKIPLPAYNSDLNAKISELVDAGNYDATSDTINKLVYQLYGLTDDEISTIEGVH